MFWRAGEQILLVFDSDTKVFQSYPFPDLNPPSTIVFKLMFRCTVLHEFAYIFVLEGDGYFSGVSRILKLDLSFIDELTTPPSLIELSVGELRMLQFPQVISIQ